MWPSYRTPLLESSEASISISAESINGAGAVPAPTHLPAAARPNAPSALGDSLKQHPFFTRAWQDRLPVVREFILRAAGNSAVLGAEADALVRAVDSARALYEEAAPGAAEPLQGLGERLGLGQSAPRPAVVELLTGAAEAVRKAAKCAERWRKMDEQLTGVQGKLERSAGAAAAFPHGTFTKGLQLLPRTAVRYVMPYAQLFVALDALTFGALGRATLETVRHERIYLNHVPKSPDNEHAHTTFSPVLAPLSSFDTSFDSRKYTKALASKWVGWVLLALGAFLVADGGVVSLNVMLPGGPSQNPFTFLNTFIFAIVEDIRRTVVEAKPAALSFAIFTIVAVVALAILFLLLVLGRSGQAAYLNTSSRDLPSMLALVLRTPATQLMVSYTWRKPYVDVARSLACACPNVWVDVQALASGVDIGEVTASVSRWSFAQVVFLSDEYLTSEACLLEFFTALLTRQCWQHLIVYCDENYAGKVSKEALQLLHDMGCTVVCSGKELLSALDKKVYCCDREDAPKAVEWWGKVGLAREDVSRDILLPSPKVLKTQPFLNFAYTRLFPPSNAIVAGHAYISADGCEVGHSLGLTIELAIALFALLCTILGYTAFFLSLAEADAAGLQLYWGVRECIHLSCSLLFPSLTFSFHTLSPPSQMRYFMPVFVGLLGLIIASAGWMLSVLVDIRCYHSGLLLPLNVAAHVNSSDLTDSGGQRKRYAVRFLVSKLDSSGLDQKTMSEHGKHVWGGLEQSVKNMCAFLQDHVGLDAEEQPWVPAGQGATPTALWQGDESAFRLVVFVIRSKAAAEEFVRHWSQEVPSACSVLVCDFRFAELTSPKLSKRMLISIGPQCVYFFLASSSRCFFAPRALSHQLPLTCSPPSPPSNATLGRNGVSEYSAYRGDGEAGEGLVSAIFDSLGAKVGAAFVEASNPSKFRDFGASSGGGGPN